MDGFNLWIMVSCCMGSGLFKANSCCLQDLCMVCIFYGIKTWCMKENTIVIFQWTRIHGMSNVWSTAHRWYYS